MPTPSLTSFLVVGEIHWLNLSKHHLFEPDLLSRCKLYKLLEIYEPVMVPANSVFGNKEELTLFP